MLNKFNRYHKLSKLDDILYNKWHKSQNQFSTVLNMVLIWYLMVLGNIIKHIENTILDSNDKNSFFKYINKKLHSKDNISPLKSHIDINIICNDFEKAECLSHQLNLFSGIAQHPYYPY